MKYLFSKNSILNIIALFLIIGITSCEDVIEVDLEKGNDRLVIDAEILWSSGTSGNYQTIYISRLTDYYNSEITRVSGAAVTIENEAGSIFYFNETEVPGTYICTNFKPVIEKDFTLHVIVEDEEYTATETLIPTPEITRIDGSHFRMGLPAARDNNNDLGRIRGPGSAGGPVRAAFRRQGPRRSAACWRHHRADHVSSLVRDVRRQYHGNGRRYPDAANAIPGRCAFGFGLQRNGFRLARQRTFGTLKPHRAVRLRVMGSRLER